MNRPVRRARALLTKATDGKLPIRVERIAEHLGATISYEPYKGDLSGLLYREGTDIVIGVNSSHSTTRQRFTIAHEIGHLLLHTGRMMFVDKAIAFRDHASSLGTNKQEIEANAFAAELLMPESSVLSEAKKLLEPDKPIAAERMVKELAQVFQVSPQSIQYRLANLGIFLPA